MTTEELDLDINLSVGKTHISTSHNPNGRPKKITPKCNNSVIAYLTDEEFARFKDYAEKRGSQSALIRGLLMDKGII